MKYINYLWRLIATGICFAVFSLSALLLGVIVFPLVNLRYKEQQRKMRLSRRLIQKSLRAFMRVMSILGVIDFDLDVVEAELIKHPGKVIISNHPSLIDVVVLLAIVPYADCVVKKELWASPFLRGTLTAAGYIQNSGDVEDLMKACGDSLNKGYALIVFPEGTRTTPGEGIKLQRGAANIALRSNADLMSLIIRCEPTTLTKEEHWYNIPPTKAKFTLRMGKAFDIADFQIEGKSISVRARYLTRDINNYLNKSLEYYG